MRWTVEIAGEFEPEFFALPQDVLDTILTVSRLLQRFGPQLGRPQVDMLNGSRQPDLKELRFAAAGGYGLALFGDRFTGMPNLGFGMADGRARDWHNGWRLTAAVPNDPGFEVNLDATRRETAGGNTRPGMA